MEIVVEEIQGLFSVCKVKDFSGVDLAKDFTFTAKTDEENSLVCRVEDVPENIIERSDSWRAFRVKGVLDFSLVGILAEISSKLAREGIALFAVSTFNTDYILVKEEYFDRAINILQK